MENPQRNDIATRSAATPEAPVDKTALRLLNLLFMLHSAPEPLGTDIIVGSAEAGYGSTNRDSDVRKFARDRKRLADLGVIVREATTPGASEREESRWEIDRAKTHAQAGLLDFEDAEAVLSAIDEHFSLHADDPVRWPLQRARAKLAEYTHSVIAASPAGAGEENPNLRHIWSAFLRKRAARFTYKPKDRDAREREVEVYAIFSQGSHTYLVGRCRESGYVHTFRTDRIVSARKSPDSSAPYTIPQDFEAESYRFLPFDFSSHAPVDARFSFPAEFDEHELLLLTNRRGTLERGGADGRWTWSIGVRNLEAAAAFALRYANRGMKIEAPDELIACKETLIRKAVCAHGA